MAKHYLSYLLSLEYYTSTKNLCHSVKSAFMEARPHRDKTKAQDALHKARLHLP